MLLTVFSICAILSGSVEVDCNEMWAIYIYDDKDVFKYCYPGAKEFHIEVLGCATYDDYRGHSIVLGNSGKGITHTGHSLIGHEIIHLQCLCNFHANPPEESRR